MRFQCCFDSCLTKLFQELGVVNLFVLYVVLCIICLLLYYVTTVIYALQLFVGITVQNIHISFPIFFSKRYLLIIIYALWNFLILLVYYLFYIYFIYYFPDVGARCGFPSGQLLVKISCIGLDLCVRWVSFFFTCKILICVYVQLLEFCVILYCATCIAFLSLYCLCQPLCILRALPEVLQIFLIVLHTHKAAVHPMPMLCLPTYPSPSYLLILWIHFGYHIHHMFIWSSLHFYCYNQNTIRMLLFLFFSLIMDKP